MTDLNTPGWFTNGCKSFFSLLDSGIYSLISYIYQIFFNIANSTIISGETIRTFFSRVQLILGIIILFKLALTLINGIINPDSFMDNKTGFSKIVTRVLTALVMLVLVIPLNIPGDIVAGSYESQLNNNGILFGTMYEFQNRILNGNTLAKLILPSADSISESATSTSMKEAGDELATIIAKTFVTININPDTNSAFCSNIDTSNYNDAKNPLVVFNLVTLNCDSKYVFSYSFPLSLIAGGLVLFIMISFTIDIAMRAFKLAILRLIAPIPIISYIDPKSENGSFGAWTKAVFTTYLDLFLRLSIVYFIIFMIREFTTNGISLDVGTGAVGKLSWVFIIIALFYFAKEAPKFITESLGIKSSGAGLFSGLGKLTGGIGAAIGTAGLVASGAVSHFNASADGQGNKNGVRGSYKAFRASMAGVVGAGSGLLNALKIGTTEKDHKFSKMMQNADQRSAKARQRGELGILTEDLVRNAVHSPFGVGDYDEAKRNEETLSKELTDIQRESQDQQTVVQGYKRTKDHLSGMQNYAKEKAATSKETAASLSYKNSRGQTKDFIDVTNGQKIMFNYNDFLSAKEAAREKGLSAVAYEDANHNKIAISWEKANDQNFLDQMLDANAGDFTYKSKIGAINDQKMKDDIDFTEANMGITISDSETALKTIKAAKGQAAGAETREQHALDDIQQKVQSAQRRLDEAKDVVAKTAYFNTKK